MNRFVTGPAFIYVTKCNFGTGGGGSGATIDTAPSSAANVAPGGTPAKTDIFYLGTCEVAPKIRISPQWEKVMNDIGGAILPIDYTYQGEDGEIAGTLTMWNEDVYYNIQSKPAEVRGVNSAGEIGTMWQLEGACRHLWIHFPYATKTAYSAAAMPTCYHFVAVRPIGEELGIGTVASKRLMAFAADRFLVPSTLALKLYDNTLSAHIPTYPLVGTTVTAHTGALI